MAACRAALPRIVNLTAGGGLHGITEVHPAIFNTLIEINTKFDNEPPAHGGDFEPVQLPSAPPIFARDADPPTVETVTGRFSAR